MCLRIYLLGQFRLACDGRPVDLPSRAAQSLLAYLVLNAGVAQRRERLAGLLWPEASEGNARAYVRQALWRTRKALTGAGLQWEQYFSVDDISICFEGGAPWWLDAAEFLSAPEIGTVEELQQRAALYQGELLPGFYDEWVVGERERLQTAYRQTMGLLMSRLTEAGAWDEVVTWGERWLRLDHAPEAAYRALMRAHAGLGNRGMVSDTYRRCVDALEREFGVEPSDETRALYEGIRREAVGDWGSALTVPSSTRPSFLEEGARQAVERPVFVARERELAVMEQALDHALGGQGRVIFVTGEAGGGKTALLQAYGERALQAHGALLVAGGNCNAHTGVGDPYLPFREILALLTGDVESRWKAGAISREHARRLWHAVPLAGQALVDYGPDLIETLLPGPALLERVTATAPEGEAWVRRLHVLETRMNSEGLLHGVHQDDLFEQFTRVLQALAEQAPLLLILDDLQWADLGSISLLFHLGRNLGGSAILAAGAYRPEEVALGREGRQHPLTGVVRELQREYGDILVNMNQAQSQEFVEALLDSEENRLGRPFREMLYRQTQGNPLFTVELLRGMQARGDLVRGENGVWTEGERLAWELLPARVEAVIAQRVGRLDEGLQATLRVASVEGELFTAEVVASVLGIDEQTILARLSSELDKKHRLVQAQSVERHMGRLVSTYRFRHIQIQKYLYSSLDEVQRVHLHQQVGSVLEGLYAERVGTIAHAVQLARHFQEAQNLEKAMQYRFLAGKRAMQMFAFEEAIAHLSTSAQLLQQLPDARARAEQELDMQLAIGMAWMSTGNPAVEMGQAFDRARLLARQTGKTEQLASAIGGQVIVQYVRAEHRQARAYAAEAVALAEEAEDPLLIMLAHWYMCFTRYAMGEFRTALAHSRQVLALYDAQKHHHSLVRLRGVDPGLGAMSYEACCLWCLGYPDQAVAKREAVVALARRLNHAFSLGDVLCYAGGALDAMLKDGDSEQAHARELIRIAEEKGMPGWLKMAKCQLGEGLALAGELEAGIAQMEAGIAARSPFNEWINTVGILRTLAEARLALGHIEQASAAVNKAQQLMEKSEERQWEAEVGRMVAALQLARGDERAAETCYLQGIGAAQTQEARSWELRCSVGLARLWEKQGKREQARAMLAEIYGWFQEGFETADLREAKAVLAGLGG